jgi:hypothetical protein
MNEFAHFFTGVFISLFFTHNIYEYVIAGYFAFYADYDCFFPRVLTHGVETHRILIGFLFYLPNTLILVYLLKTKRILFYSILGLFSHLLLDSFTYSYKEYDHHVYLWPFNSFSFHFDTIFQSVKDPWYWRVVIEIVYTSIIISLVLIVLVYHYVKKNQNNNQVLSSDFHIINLPIEEHYYYSYHQRLKYILVSLLTSFFLYFVNCLIPDLIQTWA